MNKLEQKRKRAASKGYQVMLKLENRYESDSRELSVYSANRQRVTHVFAYNKVADAGPYIVLIPDSHYPMSGLTYRQAIQLAYMLAFRRKGF